MGSLISLLLENFKQRLLYVGLQGSYLRNEADEDSDIDVMAVIEDMTVVDLNIYKNTLQSVGDYDKLCGFICGKSELSCWNPLEICHLVHTTKDYYGEIKKLVPAYTLEDERNYIKLSLNNLFHELCHRYVHETREKNIAQLPVLYKSVFFILQNIYYLNTGTFIQTKQELLRCIQNENKQILEYAIKIKSDKDYDFDNSFQVLFNWCQKTMARI